MAEEELAEFHRGLICNKRRAGLYRAALYPVKILGDKLFRTEIWFPANVATGAYRIVVYVVDKGAGGGRKIGDPDGPESRGRRRYL